MTDWLRRLEHKVSRCILLAITIMLLVASNSSAHAETNTSFEPFTGDGWSLTADGVLTLENEQG